MTSPDQQPSHQLLLRRDLHGLAIPVKQLCEWVSHGWLEQVGTLPDGGADAGDPVYAVFSAKLQLELAQRLAAQGRTDMALSPMRARSLLLRTLLSRKGIVLPFDPAADPDKDEALAEQLAASLLGANFLQEVTDLAHNLTAEVDTFTATADEAETCFDADSLLETTAAWSQPPSPTTGTSPPSPAEPADGTADEGLVMTQETPVLDPKVECTPEPAAVTGAEVEQVPPALPSTSAFDQEEHLSEAELAQLMGSVGMPAPEDTAIEPATGEAPHSDGMLAAAAEAAARSEDETVPELQESPFRESGPPVPAPVFAEPPPPPPPPPVDLQPLVQEIGLLHKAVAAIAEKPAPVLDLQPLVTALREGHEADGKDRAEIVKGIAGIASGLREFGTKVELGAALAAEAVQTANEALLRPMPAAAHRRAAAGNTALLAVGFLLLCWAGVYWLKTGDTRIALGGLVAANFAACALMAWRRP